MVQTTIDADTVTADRIGIVLAEFSSGGTERIAIRLANQWAARGRQVTIFCGREEGPARALVDPDVTVRSIMPRLGPAAPSRATMGRLIAEQLGGSLVDVIVGPGNYHVPMLSALTRALPAARPAVVCKISNPLARADRSVLRQALFLAGLRHRVAGFDALVAMSPALQAEARAHLPRTPIACANEPNLDADQPAPAAAPTNLILCIGRLVAQKNVALALETFARMPDHFHLAILGEGEDLSALRSRAWALGIGRRVSFEGYVADVRPWLARADALLATSRYEGYPAALVEAIAAHVPVITTPSSCALPEILFDESFGRIVQPEAGVLAEALVARIAERRRPAAGAVEQLTRRHAGDRAADEWLNILDRTVYVRASQGCAAAQHRQWCPDPRQSGRLVAHPGAAALTIAARLNAG
jgi:glycosyltransferase involved in cell wall biosynthesis